MGSININEEDIPSLEHKVAVLTGGTSGIGWATARLLAQKGAKVYILDIDKPSQDLWPFPGMQFIRCDISDWTATKSAFDTIGPVDMAFANAGVRELQPFLATDERGDPMEPDYRVLDVNLRGVLNVVKLSWCAMKKKANGGSIVLTSSNLAYTPSPWQPLYSATKLALISLVRSLRTIGPQDNITINAVAPSPTSTSILPETFRRRLEEAGVPVSSPEEVALAIVYSANAVAKRRVEPYGRDKDDDGAQRAKWNGRVIFTLGNRFTELEEPYADQVSSWFGEENQSMTRAQQILIDKRNFPA